MAINPDAPATTAKPKRPVESLIAVVFGEVWMLVGAFGLGRPMRVIGGTIVLALALTLGFTFDRRKRWSTTKLHTHRKWLIAAFTGEAAGIAAAVIAGNVLGRPYIIPPLIGAAVGLHFFPLAQAFHKPLLALTVTLMAMIALGSLVLATPERRQLLGFGVGLCLWGTVLIDTLRQRQIRHDG